MKAMLLHNMVNFSMLLFLRLNGCSLVAAEADNKSLLGFNAYEVALISQYVHMCNFEVVPINGAIMYPILGFRQYDDALYRKAKVDLSKILAILDADLLKKTFLVGDRVTFADIKMSMALYSLMTNIVDAESRKSYPNLTRWFETCVNQPQFIAVLGKTTLCDIEKRYQKKEEKPVEAAVAAMTINDDEEEDHADKPKGTNPLDLLPKTSFNLENWKRFYSNNDTRPTAVDYFWQNFDMTGYSMYRLIYKDNKDLTRVFMSSNLIGGFYQRLEHLRKYAFGSMCVFGEDNDNLIAGMFIFRGPQLPEAVKDVPDYDSYDFERVDTSSDAIRHEWNSYLAWDGVRDGKTFADGKIFK